jgi:mxaJ protein
MKLSRRRPGFAPGRAAALLCACLVGFACSRRQPSPARTRAAATPTLLQLSSEPDGLPARPPVATVTTESHTLRVCADPNNMPFSNRRGEGFENRLAALVGRALAEDVRYTFWPQRRGFLRLTLNARRCDVVMGVPLGTERVLTTRSYYRSSYVFVYGPKAPRVRSFDAPELRSLRIGVPVVGDDGANPPPIFALVDRGLIANVRGYSVFGDYRDESPPSSLVRAVRDGAVDLAVAWGPLAGYYARHGQPTLSVRAVPEREAPPGQHFEFAFAMAVRKDDAPLRDRLDDVLRSHTREIGELLDSYGVPRL